MLALACNLATIAQGSMPLSVRASHAGSRLLDDWMEEHEYQREYKATSNCRHAACPAGATGDRGSARRQIPHGSGRRHSRKVDCGVEFPQPGKNASSVYPRRLL